MVLIVLALFTLAFRVLTLQVINVGPDEIDYWFSSVRLFDSLPYPVLTHRTVRWPIIIPTAIVQLILGTHPVVYYIGPILLSVVQTILLYRIVRTGTSPIAAAAAVILFTVFPYMIRTGSQIRPGVFSVTYLLFAWDALFRYLDSQRRRALLATALWLFVAYLTKITNLYFLPAMAAVIYLRHRRLKDLLVFGGVLLVLYATEHLLYLVFAGESMGRLGIITANHLASSYAEGLPTTVVGLLERFTAGLPFFWKLLFLVYLGAVFVGWNGSWADRVRVFFWMVLAFSFFQTFAVKSFSPVVPMESFNNRYFTPILPLLFGTIGFAGIEILRRFPAGRKVLSGAGGYRIALFSGPVVLGIVAVLTAFPLPAGLGEYYTPLFALRTHPLAQAVSDTRLVRDAFAGNRPLISVDAPDGFNVKSLDTANRVYFDFVNGELPESEIVTDVRNGVRVDYFFPAAQNGSIDAATPVIWCDRRPFRLSRVEAGSIPSMKDYFR